jgi:diguanylate cyclase (GGDEF)-like protein/PAS domain S-box-containing protein
MERDRWRLYLICGLAAAAGYLLLPDAGRAQAAVQVACDLGAFAAILAGVAVHRPVRRAGWMTLAAGKALYVAGTAAFYAYPAFSNAVLAFPSFADALYLCAYVLLVLGVGLLASRGHGRDWSKLLDGAIVVAGAGLISFIYLVLPSAGGPGVSNAGRIVAVAYPLLDVVLLAVGVRLAMGGLGTPAQRLLGLWLASQLAADSWYLATVLRGEFQPGHPVNVLWLLSFAFLGAAALHPSMRALGTEPARSDRGSPRARLAVLAAASLLAPTAAIVFGVGKGHSDAIAIGAASAVIFLLVIARMAQLMVDVGVLRAAEARLRASESALRQEIAERKLAEQSMHRLAAIVQSSSDAIYSVAPDLTVTAWNPAAEALFGWRAEQVVGHPVTSVWPPEQLATDGPLFERALAGQVVTDLETVRLRSDGGRVPVALTWSPIKDDAGGVIGVSVIGRDITERKRLESQLVHQALHDPLTGLANRALFTDRLEHAIARAARPATTVAVLVIDLDRFKDVNDSLGHEAGDALLAEVAARLERNSRAGDTVARLGGDEFAVLLEDISAAKAVRAAELLLEALARPLTLHGRDMTPSAGVGIAFGSGEDAATLLRNADVAMYAAKGRGKAEGQSRYRIFEPDMHARVVDRLELAADLRHAPQRRELRLRYQPEVHLRTGRIAGFEALLRWQHPTRGMVAPDEFIPLAEENGLIVPIGRWVLEEACRQGRDWQRRWPADPPLAMAVNLSARQLRHAAIVDEVCAALATAGLPAPSLTLEITETAVIEDLDLALATLAQLHELGVRLALDDFGTGYSSLSYLHRLPVDILKIDRSFVSAVAGSPEESALVRAIVQLGQTLALETVAEGVETSEQLAELRRLDCQLGQGYYFAKPLDEGGVGELLEREGQHIPA